MSGACDAGGRFVADEISRDGGRDGRPVGDADSGSGAMGAGGTLEHHRSGPDGGPDGGPVATGGASGAVPDGAGTATDAAVPDAAVPDAGQCHAPDVLVVLDRSSSMNATTSSGTARWSASVDAVNTVVGEQEARVRFGLMTFPTADATECAGISDPNECLADATECALLALGPYCPVSAACQACADALATPAIQCAVGGLDRGLALDNARNIAMSLTGMVAVGATPTAQTLQAAGALMTEARVRSSETRRQLILLITDGEPNCMEASTPDTTALTETLMEIDALAAAGVLTHVIGFATAAADSANGLDRMAAAGGTGAAMHTSVDSATELATTLRGALVPPACE